MTLVAINFLFACSKCLWMNQKKKFLLLVISISSRLSQKGGSLYKRRSIAKSRGLWAISDRLTDQRTDTAAYNATKKKYMLRPTQKDKKMSIASCDFISLISNWVIDRTKIARYSCRQVRSVGQTPKNIGKGWKRNEWMRTYSSPSSIRIP